MAVYRFARCELDSDQHQLLVSGIRRHVEPQVFDLLLLLAERGNAIVSHEELIEKVWKGRIVSDSAISVRINAARKLVGDNGSRQAIIKTVARRGFKLAVGVSRVDDEAAPAATEQEDNADSPGKPVLGIFPFESLGQGLAAYLVRGIAEDIATELSRFSELVVIAPYSTFRHDFEKQDQFAVGDGAIERVTVRLLDAANGSIVWSDSYRFNDEEYFDAQADAIAKIVSSLKQGLNSSLLGQPDRVHQLALDIFQ